MGRHLDLQLLGDFRAEIDAQLVLPEAWRHGRALALVELLAISPRKRLSRDQVLEALWPGSPPDAGGASVRKAVHFARRALGGEETVEVRAGLIELWPSGEISTDVDRFEAASTAALASGRSSDFRTAALLYPGDLLPNEAEEWSEEPRVALRNKYSKVLRGAKMWNELLDVDPTAEEAHRELMRGFLEAGNRQSAIRQFERLREVLRDELGVGPDPASVELYEQVLAREGRDAPTAAERARALLAWGLIHWKRRDFEEAERTALEARALAVDAGLGAQVGEASMLLASVGLAKGEWRSFLRDELVETVRRNPDLAPFVFDSNLCFMEFCLYLPDGIDEMAKFADDLRDAALSAGSTRALALATLIRGETQLLAGRLDDAEETLREAVNLHRDAGTDSGQSLSLERLAEVSTAQGQRWKARRFLISAQRLADDDPLGDHLLVKVRGAMVEAAPDPTEAAAVATDGELALVGADVCEQCSMSFHVAAARAFADAGDAVNARRQLNEAERISEMWQGGLWGPAVDEARRRVETAVVAD